MKPENTQSLLQTRKWLVAVMSLPLQLSFAPTVGAATITITESAPNIITVNDGGPLNVNFTAGPLTVPPVGQVGWAFDTSKLPTNPFTFGGPFLGPASYFQEPSPALLNVVMIDNVTTLSVASDFEFTGMSPPFTLNNTPVKIGSDTKGNPINLVFIDSIPDPDTPEPSTLALTLASAVAIAVLALRRPLRG